ncbi:MlaC/ttg2D family ABC transporter substrate-binding protein [Elioraea tepidiphila]|uniref:MlaC/ttg2D family ABC transporter substrate-binding protein n=1 Tax=Elioraea tepidiphila TaxID=457934 RepID=UPI0003673B74|nr:ABC transporter substrate-binding protein [Elioraea tepidiphila]
MQRRVFLTGLLAALPLAGAWADDRTSRAAAFIEAQGKALVAVLDSDAPLPEKRTEVARILREAVDVRGVGQFVLGRHWRTASETQRNQFLELFEETLVRNLSARFGELQGVTFEVGRAQPRGEEGVSVATTVNRPGQPPVLLDWLVSEASGRPLIVDLVAEGTSLRITQRSEYSAVIQRGGGRLESLLEAMRRQLAQLEARELASN